MPRYGYARVSPIDETLRRQRAAPNPAGCAVIRTEQARAVRRTVQAIAPCVFGKAAR